MAYHKLPNGVPEFIQTNAEGRSNAELAEMANTTFGTSFTASSIKAYKANHGIRSGIKPKPPSVFTPQMQEYILAHHNGVPYADMADMVNQHFGTSIPKEKFRWFYQNNKLRCGVRWTGKKAVPGSVSQKKDDYQYIKMEDGTWRLYHHFLWEQAYGPVPPGHMVTFLDGNIQNTDLSNLALVSRAEQMQVVRDRLRFDNPELTKTGILIAKIKVAASKQKQRRKSSEPRNE